MDDVRKPRQRHRRRTGPLDPSHFQAGWEGLAVVTFSLCGFANISSIAILIGGIGGMAPSRKHDIARLGWKAVLGGTLANLLSATIAGFLLTI